MKITNITKKNIIAQEARIADTFMSRLVGLLNRDLIASQEALVITQCNSIHMFFMKFAIDAVFVDRNDVVVGLVKNIKPFQLSRIFFKSSYVIELAPGIIESKNISVGDHLSIDLSN